MDGLEFDGLDDLVDGLEKCSQQVSRSCRGRPKKENKEILKKIRKVFKK